MPQSFPLLFPHNIRRSENLVFLLLNQKIILLVRNPALFNVIDKYLPMIFM